MERRSIDRIGGSEWISSHYSRAYRSSPDVEVLFIANRLGFTIEEVPVRWSHVEGTKVGIGNGAQSFLELLVIVRNQWAGKYE